MGRKDRERFLRLREANPDYQGFRGTATVEVAPPPPPPATESVTCSVCNRRRNVNVGQHPGGPKHLRLPALPGGSGNGLNLKAS